MQSCLPFGACRGDRRHEPLLHAYDAENRMLSARPVAPSEGDLAVINAYAHRHRRILKRVEHVVIEYISHANR